MAVNFPNNPILNQTFSVGGITWRWNGYAWNRIPDPGAKGELGDKGDKGGQGLTGEQGVKGDKGDKGIKGDVEEKGNKGEKGEKGTKGEKGEKGIKGDKGFKGDKGDKGQKGEKGTKGEKGDKGTKGDKGQKGEDGQIGAQGDKAGLRYEFSNDTNVNDPGSGKFKYNNTAIGSITEISIDAINADGVDVSDYIALWDDTTNPGVEGHLLVLSNDNTDPTFAKFDISSVTDNSGWLKVIVTNGVGTIPSDTESCVLQYTMRGDKGDKGEKGIKGEKGTKGDKGQKGEEGEKGIKGDKGQKGEKGDKGTKGDKGQKGQHGNLGAQGDKAGLRYQFSNSTSMADPGGGIFRYNSGTLSSISAIAIDATTKEGTDVSDYIATWDDTTSSVKGHIIIKSNENSDATLTILQVNSVTDNTGWLQINVEGGASTIGNIPSNSEECVITFSRTGQKGAPGTVGDKGEEGEKGIKGDKGEKGQKGLAGENADKGEKGDKGNKGTPGENADKGEKGTPADKGQPGEEPDKGEKGAPADKGQKGTPADKGQKGAPADKGQPGEKGGTGDANGNAGTVTVRTDNGNAWHKLIFVDNPNDNQQQILKMEDENHLMWNPYAERLAAHDVQSYRMRDWANADEGTAGDLITSGGLNSGWSWISRATLANDIGGDKSRPYNRFLYTGSLTGYTPTTGSVMVRVQLIGGGGGSGAFNTTGTYEHGTFGGGGGAYSEIWIKASDIVNGGIGAGAGGTAGTYGNNQTTGKNGGNGGTSEFYSNYSSAGILLRANGGYGSEGYGNSISNGHGIGATTTNAYSVLSGSYPYMSAPTLLPGHNGNRNLNDHTINNTSTHYTSLDAGFAGDGNPYYGKGAHGRYSSANSSGNHGVAGNTGCVIITEFGDF